MGKELVKNDKREGYFPDNKRSKNTIYGKTTPKATFYQNKNVLGRKESSTNRI